MAGSPKSTSSARHIVIATMVHAYPLYISIEGIAEKLIASGKVVIDPSKAISKQLQPVYNTLNLLGDKVLKTGSRGSRVYSVNAKFVDDFKSEFGDPEQYLTLADPKNAKPPVRIVKRDLNTGVFNLDKHVGDRLAEKFQVTRKVTVPVGEIGTEQSPDDTTPLQSNTSPVFSASDIAKAIEGFVTSSIDRKVSSLPVPTTAAVSSSPTTSLTAVEVKALIDDALDPVKDQLTHLEILIEKVLGAVDRLNNNGIPVDLELPAAPAYVPTNNRPRHNPEPISSNKEKKKVIIVIGANKPNYLELVPEFSDTFDIRLYGSDDNINQITKVAKQEGARTILLTDFIRHAVHHTLKSNQVKFILLKGAITKLRGQLIHMKEQECKNSLN